MVPITLNACFSSLIIYTQFPSIYCVVKHTPYVFIFIHSLRCAAAWILRFASLKFQCALTFIVINKYTYTHIVCHTFAFTRIITVYFIYTSRYIFKIHIHQYYEFNVCDASACLRRTAYFPILSESLNTKWIVRQKLLTPSMSFYTLCRKISHPLFTTM